MFLYFTYDASDDSIIHLISTPLVRKLSLKTFNLHPPLDLSSILTLVFKPKQYTYYALLQNQTCKNINYNSVCENMLITKLLILSYLPYWKKNIYFILQTFSHNSLLNIIYPFTIKILASRTWVGTPITKSSTWPWCTPNPTFKSGSSCLSCAFVRGSAVFLFLFVDCSIAHSSGWSLFLW